MFSFTAAPWIVAEHLRNVYSEDCFLVGCVGFILSPSLKAQMKIRNESDGDLLFVIGLSMYMEESAVKLGCELSV